MAYGYFEPSTRSFVASTALARPNYSSAWRTTTDVVTFGGAAIVRAASNAKLTKDAKYIHAMKQVEKYKLGYRKCKARLAKKGKKAYPADKRTGVFASNCHTDYKKWKKWEQKAADAARKVRESLKKKGKLDKDMEHDLLVAENMPQITAKEERAADVANRKRQIMAARPGMSEDEALMLAEDELPEDAYEDDGGSDYTVPLLAVGAVVILGGGAWWLATRKKPAAQQAA